MGYTRIYACGDHVGPIKPGQWPLKQESPEFILGGASTLYTIFEILILYFLLYNKNFSLNYFIFISIVSAKIPYPFKGLSATT